MRTLYKITIFQYRCETMKKKKIARVKCGRVYVLENTPRTRQSGVEPPEERESPASFSRGIADACTHHLRVLGENDDIYRARIGREERPSPSVPIACTVTLSLFLQSL